MFLKSAELYDRIYTKFKDYESEALRIHQAIQRKNPLAKTVLDIACGTGEHAKFLRERYGYQVDGVDLDEGMIALARKKNPGGNFFRMDMTGFDLGRTYDAVICLFGSIGYLLTPDRVTLALSMFRNHSGSDTVILVEPWFTPGALKPEKTLINTAESENLKIVRMASCEVEDRISTLHFEYLIGTRGNIQHASEVHKLGLFTVEEMNDCFSTAGLTVEFEEEAPSGRGLYIAGKK